MMLAGLTTSTADAADFGVALTPPNFPSHTPKDMDEMFRQARELADVAIYIYQWGDPNFKEVAPQMVKRAKSAGLKTVLSISPTRLEGARGDLDLPDDVRRKAGRNPSFRDKDVHLPFIRDVLELAQLKPEYLCLATEINMLAFKDIKEYVTFAHVYKRLYPEIKKVAPDTKVFVSFQWDFYNIMDEREPRKIAEHTKLIDVFRPELDVLAFTSYPSGHFRSPAEIPADYYARISRHTKPGDPIAFTEIGWPSEGKGGDEGAQEQFIKRLPQLLSTLKPFQVSWSLLHDVQLSAFGADLASTGLLTRSGRPKPALNAIRQFRRQLKQ